MSRNENALPEATAEALQPEVTDKKPGKLFIIISYVLALASLIAMLFVPLFDGKMFIQYLFMAVAPILELFGVTIPDSVYGEFFITNGYTAPLYFGILLTLIYIAVVLALIMLIPVIAGKASKGTNLRCAFAAEHIAFIFILAYVSYEVLSLNYLLWYDFALIIPLGVITLVMAAQSIKYKGGLGVAKFIIFLLSLVTLFTLFNIVAYIPALETPLKDLSGIIGANSDKVTFIGSEASALLPFTRLCRGTFEFNTTNIPVLINQIISLALPMLLMVSIFLDTIGLVAGNKTKANGEPNPHKGWFVVAAIRYSLIIVLIAAAVALSFLLEGFGKVGIYMYLTAVLVLLTFIVEIIRYCVGKSKVKAYRKEQETLFKNETIIIKDDTLAEEPAAEEVTEVADADVAEATEYQTNIFGDEPITETETVEETAVDEPTESIGQQLSIMDAQTVETEVEAQPVEEVVEAEAITAEPVEEAAQPVIPVAEETVAEETFTEPVAQDNSFNLFGEAERAEEPASIDPFVDKLTDEERAQFFDVFINRNKGKFSSIPVYTLNGNNSDFFPSVFVHINRMRNLCSDSLLAKIYKEIGND